MRGLALASLALAACAGTPPRAQAGPAGETGCERVVLGPGDYSRTLIAGGRTREYHLHVPDGYRPRQPTPLVVAFHGHDSEPEALDRIARLRAASDREGFLLALPLGFGNMRKRLTWNAGTCCGRARKDAVDDVAFARELVEAVNLDVCVDRRRVFALGFSSGAMLAHRLACEAAETYAAIAAVAGDLSNVDRTVTPRATVFACAPARPVSVLMIHGLRDACIPYGGGGPCWPAQRHCGTVYGPVQETVDGWLERAHCAAATKDVLEVHGARCERYPCDAGAGVEVCSVDSGGHSWPGGTRPAGGAPCAESTPSQALDATDLAWSFFTAHPRAE